SAQGTVVVPDIQAPTAAGAPTAVAPHQTVSLSWVPATDNVGVTGYDVYRSDTDSFTPAEDNKIGTVTAASATDTPGAGTWYYRVVPTYAAGTIGPASPAGSAVVPDETAPATPDAPTASMDVDRNVVLSWTRPHDNIGVTGYKLYRSATSGF